MGAFGLFGGSGARRLAAEDRVGGCRCPNEAVVGFVVGSVVAPVAELESIGVSHLNQGQGIGGALLRALRKALGEAGAEEILLEVRASNRRAIGFYEAAGFLEAGRRAGYYAGSEAGAAEDALVMRSELGG